MVRWREKQVRQDLAKKLVFLIGPRQVGKTFLARQIAAGRNAVYLNYDSFADREVIAKMRWPAAAELVIFDEIHKFDGWKQYLKGVYDTRPAHQQLLVTGSARLDTFRQGGESMAGRFFTHHLMPLTPCELRRVENVPLDLRKAERLITRGGFPEPFLAETDVEADRWRRDYVDGLIREDILDFSNLHDLRSLKLVLELLRRRVGSPVSMSSIARDAALAPNTVKRYLEVFEALCIIFRIYPHSRNIGRSLLKEPKVYFYDTGLVLGDRGVRVENHAAVALLAHVFELRDLQGADAELRYLRTKEGREVDFCVARDDSPVLMAEVKLSDPEPDRGLRWFHATFGIPAVQLVHDLRQDEDHNGIAVRRLNPWLEQIDAVCR